MCSCISSMASRILSFKVLIVSGLLRRQLFDCTPQIIVQRCQIAAPWWPNDFISAAENAIFKNRAQHIECSFGYVGRSAVLLKPNVVNIILFNFCEQKFVQLGPKTIAIACNGLFLLIFEEKWPNYASEPKSAPNSDSGCVGFSMYACGFSVTILLVYIPAKIKTSFIWKDDVFCQNRHVSRSVRIFPSVVQAYTQPYSFGGGIKLIICQIRHELSVTIYEISTSWKKR